MLGAAGALAACRRRDGDIITMLIRRASTTAIAAAMLVAGLAIAYSSSVVAPETADAQGPNCEAYNNGPLGGIAVAVCEEYGSPDDIPPATNCPPGQVPTSGGGCGHLHHHSYTNCNQYGCGHGYGQNVEFAGCPPGTTGNEQSGCRPVGSGTQQTPPPQTQRPRPGQLITTPPVYTYNPCPPTCGRPLPPPVSALRRGRRHRRWKCPGSSRVRVRRPLRTSQFPCGGRRFMRLIGTRSSVGGWTRICRMWRTLTSRGRVM